MEYRKNAGMDEYKVSVIVPVYNVETYLEECVDSLLGQTLEDIEILLIDDGSTDSSGVICDRYAEEYSNVSVIHKMNGGQGAARNLGLLNVKGRYVYYMDSDDLLEIDALRFLYEEAEKKQLDVLMFSAECFSDSSTIKFNIDEYKRTKFLNEVKTGDAMFADLYYVHEYYCSIPMRFFNKKYLIENEFAFPEDIIHEDEIFGFLSLIKAERVECVSYRFYKRRYREGSTMTGKKAYSSASGYLHTWKEILLICKDFELKGKEVYLKFASVFFSIVRKLYYSSFDNVDKKQFRQLRKELIIVLNKRGIKLSKGEKIFLCSPSIYGLYRRILKK